MIIQTAAEGQPRLVVRQVDHAHLAGQFAAAFGNADFAPLDPRSLMEYVTAHHDDGWDIADDQPQFDPRTGLPYQFTETPRAIVNVVHARSPELNEREHDFCGLLASMHTWGLYYGRYGLTERVAVDYIAAEHKPAVLQMLQGERVRQARLQSQLAARPGTAAWADDHLLRYNYKRLQFFDMLALYFNMTHAAARHKTAFRHVARTPDEDVTVTLQPLPDGRYRLTPFPFHQTGVEAAFRGRYLQPVPASQDLAGVLNGLPYREEQVVLVP